LVSAAAAAIMIKQPNLMARRPDTLRWVLFTAAVWYLRLLCVIYGCCVLQGEKYSEHMFGDKN
jgi:hypothetical protein